MVMTAEERARIRRQVEDEQGSQGNVDARDKDQGATTYISEVDASAPQKKKTKRKKPTGNEKAMVPVPSRLSPHISPRPTHRVPIPTDTSTLPANNWRAKLALKDCGGESQSIWDVQFPGEGVISHYTTPFDIELIKDLGFEQSLEAISAYGLWSASLAFETRKTLKEERSRYLSSLTRLRSSLTQTEIDLQTKTDAFDTLSESFDVTKDELQALHLKYSELESKMKSLQVSDKEKDKKLEGIAKELEKRDKRVSSLEKSSLEEHEYGFSRAVEQFRIVHRGLDVSGINSKFDVKEGRVVDPEARSTFGVVTDRRKT
jgi:hypothetical protein